MDEILLRDLLNETSRAVPSNGPNCFSLLYKWIGEFLLLGTVAKIERKCVTSCYNFWFSTIVLDRDGHFHCRTMEEKNGLPFSSWVQSSTGKSYTPTVRFFSMSHLQDHGLLRSKNCVIMVTWQRDVKTSPLYWSGSQCHWSDSLSRQTLLIFDRQWIFYLVISSDLCFEIWDVILNVATSTTTRVLSRFQKLFFKS